MPRIAPVQLPSTKSWPPRILGPLARHLHQICSTAVTAEVGAGGLTLMEYGVLVLLGDSPGIDQNTMADWQAIDRTTISATVQSLEEKKLIDREVNEQDRRGRLLYLSKAGATLRARLRPKSLAAQGRLLTSLTPVERELFLDLLLRVVKANQNLARPGSGRRKPSRSTMKAAS
jgi:DNA-binding MarR family transcriptional regulator